MSKLGLPTGTLGEKNGKLGLFIIFRNQLAGFHRSSHRVRHFATLHSGFYSGKQIKGEIVARGKLPLSNEERRMT